LETNPEWKDALEIPGGDTVKGGWIYKDGALKPIVAAVKKTIRNPVTLFPESVEMTLTDATGRNFQISGEMTAAANWRAWHILRWSFARRDGHAAASHRTAIFRKPNGPNISGFSGDRNYPRALGATTTINQQGDDDEQPEQRRFRQLRRDARPSRGIHS
jgi:hypothetical protein